MLKQKYNNNIPKMEKGLETILTQNKTKKDQAEVVRQEFKKYFKIKESVNEVDTKKADTIRKSMPGYVGTKFAKKASDEDILTMADLKDQKAEIYNRYVKIVDDAIAKLQKKYNIKENADYELKESVNERAPEPEIDRNSANFQSTIRQIKGVIKQAQQLLEYMEQPAGYSDNRLSVYLNKGLITRKAKELTSATQVTSTVLNNELKTYERLYNRWYRNNSKG